MKNFKYKVVVTVQPYLPSIPTDIEDATLRGTVFGNDLELLKGQARKLMKEKIELSEEQSRNIYNYFIHISYDDISNEKRFRISAEDFNIKSVNQYDPTYRQL